MSYATFLYLLDRRPSYKPKPIGSFTRSWLECALRSIEAVRP